MNEKQLCFEYFESRIIMLPEMTIRHAADKFKITSALASEYYLTWRRGYMRRHTYIDQSGIYLSNKKSR